MALTKADKAFIVTLVAETIAATQAVVAAPATASAGEPKPRTFATKAEREAGNGFPCSCGRNDLRVTPHSGSFHKMPDGKTIHTIE